MLDPLVIAGRSFPSRLIVGTGKYKSFQETARALEASGAEMVTVAVRRINLDRNKESLLDYIDPKKYFLLPNTAGCYTADEAIRAARLGREVGLSDWVKIEVIGDQATLYPDHARSHSRTGERRIHRSPLHVGRHRLCQAPARCRSERCYAIGCTHRKRTWNSEFCQHSHLARNDHRSSPDTRCGRRHSF